MKYRYVALAVMLLDAAVLLPVVSLAVGHIRQPRGAPRYTVAALRDRLDSQAVSVVGRTLRVRGVVQNCGPYDTAPPYCLAPAPPADPAVPIDPIPVVWASPDPLRRWLAALPLLGAIVPGEQPVSSGQVGIYMLRLRVQASDLCGDPVCYEALLLDATSPM
jgi:hypothetical protein